jgi:FKBP-type peptidyl-prolyl cis-trans isomerase SlyD
MQIQNQTVVSMRYIMKNADGDIMEENMNAAPVQYVHGAGTILPSLESSLYGLKAGDRKLIHLTAASGLTDEDFIFDIIIDDVRTASEDEILPGHPVQKKDTTCGTDCNC